MKIEIKNTATGQQDIPAGTTEKGKKYDAFTKVSQTAYIHGLIDRAGVPEAFPVKVTLDLGTTKSQRPPYPVGFYEVEASSFFVDRFDNLRLGTLNLRPLSAALKAAA